MTNAPTIVRGGAVQTDCDVLIVGAGLAGLFMALKLAPRTCTVISAAPLGKASSSAWAQGGLAAALDPEDSAEAHAADTVAAGAGLVDPTIARLIAEDGSFNYVADSYADDLPYWLEVGGRRQLVVPYTLDANDMRFATPQGFNAGDQFEAYLRDSFDELYREGHEGAPKMMSIGLHCRLIGRPGRIAALRRFLEYAKSHADVWFARRIDIAEHWAEAHPR